MIRLVKVGKAVCDANLLCLQVAGEGEAVLPCGSLGTGKGSKAR